MNWQEQFEQEITHAEAALRAGEQGKARVCARRAAGVISKETLRRQNVQALPVSALECIQKLSELESSAPEVRRICANFLLRVNEEKGLPDGVDLIAQARWLRAELIGD